MRTQSDNKQAARSAGKRAGKREWPLAIVFSSEPDWLRGFGEFSGTVTEQV